MRAWRYIRSRSWFTIFRVRLMRALRLSDYKRWSSPTAFDSSWGERARMLAESVPKGTRSVLELGAATDNLRRHLPGNVTYTAADLVPRGPDTIVFDLNSDRWPELPFHDVIVMSGVVEYIHDVPRVISRLAPLCSSIVCSYAATDFEGQRPIDERRKHGWVNDYRSADIEQVMRNAGFACTWRTEWNDQFLYVFAKRETT